MANPSSAPELLYEERTAVATKAEHERRLKLARSVRDVRDLLTSSSGVKPAFDYELLRLYAENRISHSPALLLLIAIIGFAATLWTGDYFAVMSIPLAMVIHAMNVSACRRFLTAPLNPTELRRYRTLFTSFDFLFGISWVFNIYIFVDLKSHGAGDFSLFAMLMVIAVFSVLASSVPAAVYAATVPVAGAVTLFYLLRGAPRIWPRAHGRRRDLFHHGVEASARFGALDAGGARAVRFADRRGRAVQGQVRRDRATRRGGQSRQVALPGADEP
jgi:two-component system cell cycle sensor histidine kinase PleC